MKWDVEMAQIIWDKHRLKTSQNGHRFWELVFISLTLVLVFLVASRGRENVLDLNFPRVIASHGLRPGNRSNSTSLRQPPLLGNQTKTTGRREGTFFPFNMRAFLAQTFEELHIAKR